MTARSPPVVVNASVLLTDPPSRVFTSDRSVDAPAQSCTIWRSTCHEISTGIAMRQWPHLPPRPSESQPASLPPAKNLGLTACRSRHPSPRRPEYEYIN